MSPLLWYWHRLRAMGPAEIAAHTRKKILQRLDVRGMRDGPAPDLDSTVDFPKLPRPEDAPSSLREALARDTTEILAGRWKAFGHLEIQVDDPPAWHKDYLAGRNLATNESAFKLNHRELPGGADIKLIWELSRWYQPVRLAMAGYLRSDERAASKCVEWLADWVRHNPPYRGWNWTSALEVGMRLVQFAWIDALLKGFVELNRPLTSLERGIGTPLPAGKTSPAEGQAMESAGVVEVERLLKRLRGEILPAHVRFAWRYRSFGSSANNHLIGELAGLILAIARWPELSRWATSLGGLQRRWEREVLAQFAEDGGNREQALNYHLFSWEFCWQTHSAIKAAGLKVSSEVADRLRRAAGFFVEVQAPMDPWDYGDSDDGYVTPVFAFDAERVLEWYSWLQSAGDSPAIEYWWGLARLEFGDLRTTGAEWKSSDRKPAKYWDAKEYVFAAGPARQPARERRNWLVHNATGVAVRRAEGWQLRIDASPLGYLATAAHGHLDALHLSVWYHGVAMVIDPGTGAYYADKGLRAWLASRLAHNCPLPAGWGDRPRRLGTFLWDRQRPQVDIREYDDGSERGEGNADWIDAKTVLGPWENERPGPYLWRKVIRLHDENGWVVEEAQESDWPVNVRWQFAPGAILETIHERKFRVARKGVVMEIAVSEDWAEVHPVAAKNSSAFTSAATTELEAEYAGMVSPAFRKVEWAPFLKLVARPQPGKPCVFRTNFLASRSS